MSSTVDGLLDLLVIGTLIGVNAVLAGSEMAIVSLREGQLRRMSAEGGTGAKVAALARDPNRYLSAIQLGITLAGFLAAATAAVSISEPIASALSPLGRSASTVAIGLVTLVVAMATLVLGELVPKRLAMQRAERWSRAMLRPLSLLMLVTRPIIVVLGSLTDLLVDVAGGDPDRHRNDLTDEEIVDLVESQPTLDETQRQIITGAVQIGNRPLRAVLVARRRVVSIHRDTPAPLALHQLRSSGHSRAPVIGSSLDDVIGQVHLRDLMDTDLRAASAATPVLSLPETMSALEGLRRLQDSRTELAMVFDEHGGAAGIVTIEDLIEELVGEIYDETDLDPPSVAHLDDGSVLLPGSYPARDLARVGLVAPPGSYDTVAGLVLSRLGHLPQVGERVQVGRHQLEVKAMDRRAIASVRVIPDPNPDPGPDPDPDRADPQPDHEPK